jgi:hypothetical protein
VRGAHQRCAKDEQLCKQGAKAKEFFVLVNGSVVLHRKEAKEAFDEDAAMLPGVQARRRLSSTHGLVRRSRESSHDTAASYNHAPADPVKAASCVSPVAPAPVAAQVADIPPKSRRRSSLKMTNKWQQLQVEYIHPLLLGELMQ